MFSATFLRLGALLVLAALSAPAISHAQDAAQYPNRPIRLVVGFAPGGSNDILARLLAEKLNKTLKQPVIVENKPGGGGVVAASYVKSQPADGYTLLVGASGAMVVAAAVGTPASYSTLQDFEPISLLGTFPLVFVVSAESPYKTLSDLVSWSKTHAGEGNYSSASPTFTLAAELLKIKTGMSLQRVGYRGSNDAVVAALSNQVTAAMTDTLPAIGLLQDGKLRALGITSSKRLPELPDVPTMKEAGVDGAEAIFWTGLFAPKGLSREIVERLNAEIKNAMTDPEVRKRVQALATEPTSNTPDEFRTLIQSDTDSWKATAKAANVTVE